MPTEPTADPATPLPAPEHTFTALLELDPELGGVLVVVPFNVEAAYGTPGPVRVVATFDGFPHYGALRPLGDGHHALTLPKNIRGAIGKTWGDGVTVTVARDLALRVVEVPTDLADALALTPGARTAFELLSYNHQREYVRWVEGAKKDDTRRQRVVEAAERIAAGKKRA